jgi:tetratricopeptide (TPR) repeat protein
VRAKATDRPWTDRLVDLRVEDHDHPLEELGRLLLLHRAYESMNSGDEAMARGDMPLALDEYAAAEALFPDNDEFVFWHAVTLVTNDAVEQALPLFARAFRMNPAWMLLIPRLAEKGHLPATPELTARILAVGP